MNSDQTIGDVLVSLVRTGVAIVVGAFVSWAVRHGAHIDAASATAYITPAAIAAYYAVVRLLETQFPALGWLLGIAKAPSYTPALPAPVINNVVITPAPEPVTPVEAPEPVVIAPPVANPVKKAAAAKKAAKKV